MVGSIDKSVFSGLKLTVTPQLVPDSSIIRLQHTYSIVPDREPDKSESDAYITAKGVNLSFFGSEIGSVPYESLVGSGQTLLLLIEQPRPDDAAKGVDRYVLMLTPEHVVEAVEKIHDGDDRKLIRRTPGRRTSLQRREG